MREYCGAQAWRTRLVPPSPGGQTGHSTRCHRRTLPFGTWDLGTGTPSGNIGPHGSTVKQCLSSPKTPPFQINDAHQFVCATTHGQKITVGASAFLWIEGSAVQRPSPFVIGARYLNGTKQVEDLPYEDPEPAAVLSTPRCIGR